MNTNKTKISIKGPCSKKELASAMGISLSTLYRLLKKSGIKTGRTLLSPKKIKEIFRILGWG